MNMYGAAVPCARRRVGEDHDRRGADRRVLGGHPAEAAAGRRAPLPAGARYCYYMLVYHYSYDD